MDEAIEKRFRSNKSICAVKRGFSFALELEKKQFTVGWSFKTTFCVKDFALTTDSVRHDFQRKFNTFMVLIEGTVSELRQLEEKMS